MRTPIPAKVRWSCDRCDRTDETTGEKSGWPDGWGEIGGRDHASQCFRPPIPMKSQVAAGCGMLLCPACAGDFDSWIRRWIAAGRRQDEAKRD